MQQTKALGWLLALAICISSPAHARTLHVVASFSILADVVKQIGGAQVVVKSLVLPDGDPHEFEPSPDDARALREADIAFLSGEGLETWFQRLAKASGYKGKATIVSTGIDTVSMEEDGKLVTDPHVWNSVRSVMYGQTISRRRFRPPVRRMRPNSSPMPQTTRSSSSSSTPMLGLKSAPFRRSSGRFSPAMTPSATSAAPMACHSCRQSDCRRSRRLRREMSPN